MFHQLMICLIAVMLSCVQWLQELFYFRLLIIFFKNQPVQLSLYKVKTLIRFLVSAVSLCTVPIFFKESIPTLQKLIPSFTNTLVVRLLILIQILNILIGHDVFLELKRNRIGYRRINSLFANVI